MFLIFQGLIIYYFRIVVTQFGFELTKLIQLTNPFCNKVLQLIFF